MEKQYAGQSIENIMGEKEKQTPGKRYQLQMFLQNILEVDTEEFVLIGEELLNVPKGISLAGSSITGIYHL